MARTLVDGRIEPRARLQVVADAEASTGLAVLRPGCTPEAALPRPAAVTVAGGTE